MNDLDRLTAAVEANTAVLERIEPLLARWVAADEAMAQLAGALMPGEADAEGFDPRAADWRNDGRGGYLVCDGADCRQATADQAATIRAAVPAGKRGR